IGIDRNTLVVHSTDGGASWDVSGGRDLGAWTSFYGVASSPGDNSILAVGDLISERHAGGLELTVVERWDGAQWSVVPSPNVGSYRNYLYGVAALSTTNIW